ncbi:leucyl/phenylalanyl-tRNA--protein transferase [Pedobacter frigiditerrae]|uniref:Leucyl/phenylalanyl-tRNA--protein transferase n=1 Tax=Pedobacter frigiditerrae TaxID=2530452 RepID=A0A4V2MJE8_9SPHI|nr:leucyl/phenylalanyl-tRNA--protein transferase [Pedobacter frigiditerrae]TCC93986.1 leucyl/phenylalanyl-tRNA--protein transferase [Pedobacter frigiditerrae]
MVFRLLDDELIFPDTALAEPDGLLAIGGDLSIERLLLAYQSGIFPWFSEDDPILWYAPHERCVIFPDSVKISKSMRKILQSNVFEVTENKAFERVIEHCAKIPRVGQDGTWITNEMQQAYIKLHEKGLAHSVEVWQNNELVGGLYGVKINKVFCGESMFSLVSNASKTALIHLTKTMGFELIDCQLPNDHLMSLGAGMISREEYLRMLNS